MSVSRFIFTYEWPYLFQKKIVKNVFLHWIIFTSLSKISCLCLCEPISGLLFCFTGPFDCSFVNTVLIFVVLYRGFEVGYSISCLILFSSFSIVLTIVDLLLLTQEHPTLWFKDMMLSSTKFTLELCNWFTKNAKSSHSILSKGIFLCWPTFIAILQYSAILCIWHAWLPLSIK